MTDFTEAQVRAMAREEAAKLVGIPLDANGKTPVEAHADKVLANIAAGGNGYTQN